MPTVASAARGNPADLLAAMSDRTVNEPNAHNRCSGKTPDHPASSPWLRALPAGRTVGFPALAALLAAAESRPPYRGYARSRGRFAGLNVTATAGGRTGSHLDQGRQREPQINRLFCKPICKPDAARQRETGETEPTERERFFLSAEVAEAARDGPRHRRHTSYGS